MSHFTQVGSLAALACIVLQVQSQSDPGEPLYLTPLINSGQIEEAVEASSVNLERYPEIKSHSGFITVNPEYDSNLFFWYFPVHDIDFNLPETPVILWQDGEPGTSCMKTIFGPTGPFEPKITRNEKNETVFDFALNVDAAPWLLYHHMIYVDNPVNVGFSHTGSREGDIDSPEGAAKDTYSFLLQFFKMFPHLKEHPFFIAGVSYGGTYAINVAHLIHQMNENASEEEKINLIGIYMDSPWIEAYSQVHYGELLFNAGLITEQQEEAYLEAQHELRELITEEKFADAAQIFLNLTQVWPQQMTGYRSIYDIGNSFEVENMTELVVLNETRKTIHVGDKIYTDSSGYQQELMQEAIMKSQKDKLDDILQNGYTVMVMVGNMDIITGHVGIQKVFKGLNWEKKEQFLNGNRLVYGWFNVWCYFTRTDYDADGRSNIFMIMRNAGHGTYLKQPAIGVVMAQWYFYGQY